MNGGAIYNSPAFSRERKDENMKVTLTDLVNHFSSDVAFRNQFNEDAKVVVDLGLLGDVSYEAIEITPESLTPARHEDGTVTYSGNLLNTYFRVIQAIGQNGGRGVPDKPAGTEPTEEPAADAEEAVIENWKAWQAYNKAKALVGPYRRLSQYIRIPFGEERFTIDLDPRTIKVPSDFAKNGVGVAGDHLAELIFFEVNRFYDLMDLLNCDINLYWKNSGSKNSAITAAKPFALDANDEKIIFGWYISEDAARYAGTIEFTVEFVKQELVHDGNNQVESRIVFRLNTQPAKITIKPSLDLTNLDTSYIEDYQSLLFTRSIYSNIIDYLSAAEPVLALTFATREVDQFEFPEGDGIPKDHQELVVKGVSPDGGDIVYNWYWEGQQFVNADGVNANYKYNLVDTNKNVQILDLEDGGQKLITNVPGKYQVYVGNKINTGDNAGGVHYVRTGIVTLAAANQVEVTDNFGDLPIVYATEDSSDLKVTIKNDPNGDVSYQWYFIPTEPAADATLPIEKGSTNELDLSKIDLSGIEPREIRGVYYCVTTNMKNNTKTTTGFDRKVRVEYPPRQPDVTRDQITVKYRNTNGPEVVIFVGNRPYTDIHYQVVIAVSGQSLNGTVTYLPVEQPYYTLNDQNEIIIPLNLASVKPDAQGHSIKVYLTEVAGFGAGLSDNDKRIPHVDPDTVAYLSCSAIVENSSPSTDIISDLLPNN